MSFLDRWRRRARALFQKGAVDREMDDEIRFHVEMETDEGVRGGLPPDEARRQARVAFGGVGWIREEGRDARGVTAIEDALMDLRYGLRTLRRSPVFALVAVVTIALGVGANTAIFSVVNGVVLRPLPYREPDRLLSVWDGGHSRAEFTRVRDQTQTLEPVAAYMDRQGFSLSGSGEPARLVGAYVTADLFRVLGVAPFLGRAFATGEDLPGDDRVVVLSHVLWRDRFGGDSTIVGRTIDLDGIQRTVIGVMPPAFWFPTHQTRLWAPLVLDPAQSGIFWGGYGHFMVGRLRPGATREQTRADVRAIAERLRVENPVWTPSPDYYFDGLDVVPLRDRLVPEGSRRLLLLLLGAVGMILLIACANVANLLIARGTAREREMAIRTTLGAGSPRLARQLATESLLLAGLGAVLGLALALVGVRLLVALLPPSTPRLSEVAIDGPVLGFTALLTLVTGLLFGLLPALRFSHPGQGGALSEGGARSGSGTRQRRLTGALVAAEIALGVVLAIGAGLLVRSLGRLMEVNPGFEVQSLVSARVSPPSRRYADPERQRVFYRSLLDRLAAAPGVVAVGVTSQLPFDQSNEVMAMWVDGHTTDPNALELIEIRSVSSGYFRAMGIPLKSGRLFDERDRPGAPPVTLIDETSERGYWRSRDPLVGRVRFPWPGWISVVGVVGSVKNNDLTDDPAPAMYGPFEQNPRATMTVVVRTHGAPAAALAAIRGAVAELGPDVPVSDERTLRQMIDDSVAAPRFASMLLVAFGALALLLGAVGTYGLMAYAVERRTQEIAVRMALGARAGDVLRMVLRDGTRLAAYGIAAGLVLSVVLTRLLRDLLFEVSPTDPLTFAAVPALLAAVALFASYLPARRATRVDPMTAMRRE